MTKHHKKGRGEKEKKRDKDASGSGGKGNGNGNAVASSIAKPATPTLRSRFSKLATDVGKTIEGWNVNITQADDGNFKVNAPGTPYDKLELHDANDPRHHGKSKLRQWVVGRRFLIPLAFAIGMFAVWLFSQPEFSSDLSDLWPMLQNDMKDLLNNMTFVDSARKAIFETRDFTVGDDMIAQFGLKENHPIILMPGIVSTGLESWSTDSTTRSWFRTRLWGTSSMIRAVLTDKERWVEAIAIDLETGLDPPGHKVRAAQGLDAASEFITGYWIWQKIVQNLATIGYDTNTMDMAAYDWRLGFYNLETRDFFFTRLKMRIELMRKRTGKKVVLASHSMGGSLALYFFKWVEADPDQFGHGGGGGKDWVERNIEAWANIAGTMFGVPKAMTAFLSGEMRDTVELSPLGSYVLEKFFSRRERAQLFRRWPGASSMWMKGGDRIWGNDTSAPDDPANATDTYGRLFSFRHEEVPPNEEDLDETNVSPNLTVSAAVPYILTHTPPDYQRMFDSNYSIGFETNVKKLKANAKDHRKWSNPLEVQLPNAPSMKIYCLYGHGKETERSYWYTKGEYESEDGHSDAEGEEAFCEADDDSCINPPLNFPLSRSHQIDNEVTLKGAIPEVRSGVKFSDGDGTIATLSLGAMCAKGWRGKTRWNPAGIEVVTQEYKHSPESLDLRGGPLTADHVDILGSYPLNAALLKIAAGRGDLVKEHFGSKILEYIKKIDWEM